MVISNNKYFTLPKETPQKNPSRKKSDHLIKGITTVTDSVLFRRKQNKKTPQILKLILSLSPYEFHTWMRIVHLAVNQ